MIEFEGKRMEVVVNANGGVVSGQLLFNDRFFYQDNAPVKSDDIAMFTKTDFNSISVFGQLYQSYVDTYVFPLGINFKLFSLKIGDGAGTFVDNPFLIKGIKQDDTEVLIYSFVGSEFNAEINYELPEPLTLKSISFHIDENVGRPTYIKMYGEYKNLSLPAIPADTVYPLMNQTGVNGFTFSWLPGANPYNPYYEQGYQVLKQLGSCRIYLDCVELVKEEHKFRYKHNWRGYNTDYLFSRFKADGIFANVCIQGAPAYITNTWPDQPDEQNLLRPYGTPKEAVESYAWIGKIGFQVAARYGRNGGINLDLIEVDETQPPYETPSGKLVGMDLLTVLEIGNEVDKWWKGEDCNFLGRQFAYYMSAIYDGHKGTMGDNVGIKTADPTMQVTNAGLASFHPDFLFSFVRECDKIRGRLPNGKIDIPIDGYYSYHCYPNTAESQYSGEDSRGMCIEESGTVEQLDKFKEVNYRQLGNMKITSGETGYDLSPNSPLRAEPPVGSVFTVRQWQGVLNLRIALYYAKNGVFRNFFFTWLDDGDLEGGQFSSCGIVELTGSTPNITLVPRPTSIWLSQVNQILGDYVWTEQISVSPLVDKWENGSDVVYSLYYATEVNQTGNYTLVLPGVTEVEKNTLNEVYDFSSEGVGEDVTWTFDTAPTKEVIAISGSILLALSEKPIFIKIN